MALVELAKVQAGAKQGEMSAWEAEIAWLKTKCQNQITGQEANLCHLLASLQREVCSQKAVIAWLQAELRNAEVMAQR